MCVTDLWFLTVSLQDVSGDQSVCLCSAGGCQKRLREDVGSDDRDFIKRMKGDFDHQFSCFSGSHLAQLI